MGSLLPGWDERAPGVAPREFQDIMEEEEEGQGYFAAYAKLKKLHAEHGEPSSPVPIGRRSSLTRRSMPGAPGTPTGALQACRSLTRAETLHAMVVDGRGGAASSSFTTVTSTHHHHLAAPAAAPTHGLQRMYSVPLTRSERGDVLAGLSAAAATSPTAGGAGLLAPRTPSLDAYKTRTGDGAAVNYQWWRHFDSAALNEQPDLPPSRERQPSFVPQAAPGQELHFHAAAEAPAAAAAVVAAPTTDDVRPAVIPAH